MRGAYQLPVREQKAARRPVQRTPGVRANVAIGAHAIGQSQQDQRGAVLVFRVGAFQRRLFGEVRQ